VRAGHAAARQAYAAAIILTGATGDRIRGAALTEPAAPDQLVREGGLREPFPRTATEPDQADELADADGVLLDEVVA
jgi:hypothetical protein